MKNRLFSKIPALLLALIVSLICSSPAFAAATIVIQNVDVGTDGFNDPTPATPIGGNTGTTVGQQRLIAFQFAANIWGATLTSNITITVRASWPTDPTNTNNPPLECTDTTATLGSAGAWTLSRDFPGAPFTGTWYGAALANALSGTDRNGSNTAEIYARFNPKIGGTGCLTGRPWYYGLDTNHGANQINLVTVILHELGHGLGFQTFTNAEDGKQFVSPNGTPYPTIYDRFILDNTTGKTWAQMTDAERVASAINNGNLVWNGPQVVGDAVSVLTGGKDSSGRPRMHAPNPLKEGSSVSHWDTVAAPNQLMEPRINGDLSHSVTTPLDLTFSLMKDIGWCTSCPAPPPPPPPAPPPANDNFANAQAIAGCSSSVTGTNVGATSEPGEPFHDPANEPSGVSVWYQWTAPATGSVTIDTVGSATSYDTMLAVYTGTSVGSLTLIDRNDDIQSSVIRTSRVTFNATANTTYRIAVDGWDGDTGDFVLNWTQSNCTANPIDNNDFFVRQHYLDFLDREPEAEGFAYWTGIMNGCGTDAACLNRVRVEISSRFFIELEFQRTGFFVMRLYQASYGLPPTYAQFIADRKLVQNSPESQKQFASVFVGRQAFLTEYPATMTPSAFVTKLYDKAGVADAAARAAAVQGLTAQTKTRADVLYELVELASFQSKEYNPAFVRMQYFGYLRREVESGGFTYWIDVLTNLSPNNYRSMICAFVNSSEYQLRFNSTRGRFTELDCTW